MVHIQRLLGLDMDYTLLLLFDFLFAIAIVMTPNRVPSSVGPLSVNQLRELSSVSGGMPSACLTSERPYGSYPIRRSARNILCGA